MKSHKPTSAVPVPQMALRLLSMFTALVLIGCGDPLCNAGKAHEWGRWIDDWNASNGFGYIEQRRYCDQCGVVEVAMHK